MYKIRNIARNHLDTIHNFKHRGVWRQVHPANWENRLYTTAHIGTGSGNNMSQLQAMSKVIEGQMALKATDPMQTLVGPENTFHAWKKFCDLAGIKAPEKFFTDPASPQGQQATEGVQRQQEEMKQKEEEMRVAQLDMQAKIANAELGEAQSMLNNVQLKNQIDNLKVQLEQAKAVVEAEKADRQLDLEYDKLKSQEALKITEIESREKIEISKAHSQNKAAMNE